MYVYDSIHVWFCAISNMQFMFQFYESAFIYKHELQEKSNNISIFKRIQ